MVVALVIRVAFVSIQLVWLRKVSGCESECKGASSWKRKYLFWALIFDVLIRAGIYLVYDQVPMWVKSAVAIHDIFQLSILWSYATDLEKTACECSAGWMRDIAQGWPIMRLGMVLGAFHFAVYFAYLLHNSALKIK